MVTLLSVFFCSLLAEMITPLVSAQRATIAPVCPKFEQWRCSNACQDRCININRICTADCSFGCFCIRGYRRNEAGICIPEKECPKGIKCPENEVQSDCPCDRYCKNSGTLQVCPAVCKVGCACIPRYVRNDEGKCIPEEKCPPGIKCPENEVETKCVCDQYCKNLGTRPTCPAVCKAGCGCTPGYVRNDEGKCIPQEKCPKVDCPQNETNVECINYCNTCPRLNIVCGKRPCTRGCDCKEGYFRDSQGHCVLERDCETHDVACPKNETNVECVNTCNRCPRLITECRDEPCKPGCDCEKGYFRDREGHCVLERDCETHDGK